VLNKQSIMPWKHVRSGGLIPPFLASVLVGGEWSVSRRAALTPGEGALGTYWAPQPAWTLWRKNYCPCWESSPGHPDRSPSQYRLRYPEILSSINIKFS
jgi:hypothetical protein